MFDARLGHRPIYRREGRQRESAASLWQLVKPGDALHRQGMLSRWGLADASAFSPVEGISIEPPQRVLPGEASAWKGRLAAAVTRVCEGKRQVALGLSGGVDSMVLLALIRQLGLPLPRVVTFSTDWPGYDETERTRAVARAFQVPLEVFHFDEAEYLDALPEAIHGCESPLFNLHPVSRWLLLKRLKAEGVEVLLTGDGADPLFRHRACHLSLPLVSAMARHAQLPCLSPFLDAEVVASVAAHPPDEGKRALREFAEELGAPAHWAFAAKVPRYAPSLDLASHWDEARANRLSAQLRVPLRFDDVADVTRWTTSILFSKSLERLCAE